MLSEGRGVRTAKLLSSQEMPPRRATFALLACGSGTDEPSDKPEPGSEAAALANRAYIVSLESDELTVIDLAKLEIIAREASVPLLQDAAHSIGGSFRGRMLGSIGIGATFSFHTAKVMTSVEGGMFVTDDEELAKKTRVIRNQGEAIGKKYFHPVVGHNYRMSDLHGAVGGAQFKKLPWLLERRREIVGWYHGFLGGKKKDKKNQ